MQLKSGITLIGAIVAGAAIAGLYLGLRIGVISLSVSAGLGILGYIVAAIGASPRDEVTDFGEFMRGWLIGMNTALNFFLAAAIYGAIFGHPPGYVIGAVLAVVNLLAVFAPISQNGFYEGVVGWLNWLLPMSWPIVGLGLLFYAGSFLLYAVTAGKVEFLRVQDVGMDWKTGTFFIKGGLVANLNYLHTAFNMGNFSFTDVKSGQWHKEHEAGHTLNLAVFGTVFHLIGALDENATSRGANAFSERLAESNATGASGSNLPMWS
jgi:hypothetical protein